MITGTRVLAVIAWTAALVASLGVALIEPTLMAIAGIVCALSATGWGLLAMLRAGHMVRDDEARREREAVWARRDAEAAPFTTRDLTELRDWLWEERPVWPSDAGSFE